MKFLGGLILLVSLSAKARVYNEDFTSLNYKDSSTLIWNFELGVLHPDLLIYGYGQTATSQTTFSVSDGSHGAFEPATYSQFGTVVGNHITIDANQFPILKVTRFHLDSSHTLSSINGPLIIHSLSTVLIDGVITCNGNNGGNAAGGVGGAGGAGRCDGFSGGAGGNSSTSGSDGLPTAGATTGGGGGLAASALNGAGGGGGGSYYNTTINGDAGFNGPPDNLGGAFGVGSSDHEFTNLNGSAGGGGGSGSTTEGGSGGGAGGGTVVIHAVSGIVISNGGAILATGGNGGTTFSNGGGGGGGGGGNIKIFTPATLDVKVSGLITAAPGTGAPSSSQTAPDGSGGIGGAGRTWIGVGNLILSGSINSNILYSEGIAGFVSGTVQTATSKSFDTGSKRVTYESFVADPVSSDITLQVAGSDDNFASDDSGWINAAAISGISSKRYMKFRVSLNNSDSANPTFVNSVTLTYNPGQIDDFAFKSGGCGLVKNTPSNSSHWLMSLLLLIPLILAWRLRRPKTVRVRVRK
ncbi:hypothetical protein [Pseudobdellovibrio sp. HCB154]|uniref:hypothetical protein n=1 Tax=Pseudobdellovibrio sp. HCB154 TaxID=3386277 RepID=UPI003917423D